METAIKLHTVNLKEIEAILDLLQDAECRAFYAYADEPDKYRKGWGKVLDQKIREAVEAAADIRDRLEAQHD